MTFKAEIVFVRILIPFAMGIVFGYIFAKNLPIYLFLSLTIFLFFALWGANSFYKKLRLYRHKGPTGLVFYLFCCSLGMLLCLLHNQSLRHNYFGHLPTAYLKGYISNEPKTNNQIGNLEIRLTHSYQNKQWQPQCGTLLISLKLNRQQPIELSYGDEVLLFFKNTPIEPPYNPGEFDFKAWLATKNIYQQTFLQSNQLVKLNKKTGNPILRFALALRQRQVAVYRKLIRNDEAFAVASTLILGYRADLSAETLDAYSKTGTIHALSVSGMHVGIIYMFLNWLLFFLDGKRLLKLLKIGLICSLIWYYALLTGLSPSVLRSAVMLSIYIIAKSLNRSTNAYNILAFTAFCLLVYDPFLLWDVGFQLSFSAVFGLVYLQPKIYSWVNCSNKYLDKLWAATAVSLAAQAATFPLSIYYFHQFPLYFVISNLFILLPITILMYLGLVLLLLKLYFLAPLFEWLIIFTNKGLAWIANLPFSGIKGIWISQWELALLGISLAVLTFALARYQKKWLFSALLLLIMFQGGRVYRHIKLGRQQKMLCFSLRKNYGIAFIKGNNAILISDLTKTDRNFKFFVQPALDQLQVKRVSLLQWNQDTVAVGFSKKEQQLAFDSFKVLLLDSSLNSKTIKQLPHFDLVWIHKGYNRTLSELRKEVLFNSVVIDASIKDYRLKRYEAEANKIRVNLHILKKNNSYLIDFMSTKEYE